MTTLFNTLGLPEKARPLARLIQDYDNSVTLERLPERHPWLEDNPNKPYALVHRGLGMQEYVIESFPESMLDERIFAILLESDAAKYGYDLSQFDPVGYAKTMLEGRKREDERELANDKMAFKIAKLHDRGAMHL